MLRITRTRTKTRTREIIASSWKAWMLPKRILSWTLKHLVWVWLLWSKTLSLTFNHLGCFGVRSCPWHCIILDATLEKLVFNFVHLGWYALRPCPWIADILGCFAVRPYIPLVFNLSLYTFNRLECYRGRLVLNLQKSWMIRCKGVLDGTLQAVVLNLQTSWMQSCKILFLNYKPYIGASAWDLVRWNISGATESDLSLTFDHPWCFAVRSQPDLAIIWDATV